MLFGLALATITVASQDFPRTGVATYYAKGVIERVYEYRLRIGQISECSDCRGFVALLSPSDLGKKVWLRHPSKGTIGPLLVVDCAAKQDVKALQARGQVVVTGGHFVVTGGHLVVIGGQSVVMGGQAVVTGGHFVVTGGHFVAMGGQSVVIAGHLVVTPGHFVVTDGHFVVVVGQVVVPGGQLVASAGHCVATFGHWVGTTGETVTTPGTYSMVSETALDSPASFFTLK